MNIHIRVDVLTLGMPPRVTWKVAMDLCDPPKKNDLFMYYTRKFLNGWDMI